jgi:3-dehydroquinate synthase
LVEVLKLFLALDASAFKRYAGRLQPLANRQDYTALVSYAIGLKLKVVAKDPFDRGSRQVLNLGHTTGHAYESLTGSSHGKSVALGLLVALELSHRHFGLPSAQQDQAVAEVLSVCPRLTATTVDERLLWEVIQHDKKRRGRQVYFVLLPRIGKHLVAAITYRRFRGAWRRTMERIAR